MNKKITVKALAVIIAVIIALSVLPLSVFAAPASDIPAEMLDNVFLDALAYTGYKVQTQKDNGTIFVQYSNAAPSSVRSGIGYGTGPSGLETSNGAPDIAKFRSSGLCCASYVSYVYYNYLTNIAHMDIGVPCPANPRSAVSYNEAANSWVSGNKARRISFSQSGSSFSASEKIPIGSLVVFKNISDGDIAHVAIYAGYYNGQHFVTHVGSDNGPEFCTIVGMTKGSNPEAVVQIVAPNAIEAVGKIQIYKKDTDGRNLSGAVFAATNNSTGVTYIIGPTDANGYAETKEGLPYGTYTVKETVVPTNYTLGSTSQWTVTVSSATQTVVLNAVNNKQTGSVRVVKSSEDNFISGITFTLSGTSAFGDNISLVAKTNTDGTAIFENIPIGNYTVSETDVADKYVVPATQNVTVAYGNTSSVTVKNILKKFRVTVKKADSEKETAQGDAVLSGAEYGLYKDGKLMASYFTDSNGKFTTDYFSCGNDYYIKEIAPSKGYLLDTKSYPLSAEPKNFTVEKNDLLLDVKESVIKGKLSIIKHADDGQTQIETPEANAEFQIYLKSAGSYSSAKDTEKDILTTDNDGFAESKLLPYGKYTVHQTKGLEGREFIKDFDVDVSENGKNYKFLINNAVLYSDTLLIKTDAETGKTVPASGVGFKVKDTKTGEFITQHINYPTPEDLTVFYTAEDGTLMLPYALPYGNYELYEVKSTKGYTLNNEAIPFTVDGQSDVVTVSMPNMPQKGKFVIEKKGEIFSSVQVLEDIYLPIYTLSGLKGATFNIVADEDIVTPDGTVRMVKGTVADTVTTDENGKAESKELYLGKYVLIETKAPAGMVLETEPKAVSLEYADETVKVTVSSVALTNKRQKVNITVNKQLESDVIFRIGENEEIKNVVFGLFAAEDITAADGSIIPQDGLLGYATPDSEGNAVFTADIPYGSKLYVKEIRTDSHYLLSDEKYYVSFDIETNSETVNLYVNNGNPIENKIIRGTVKGHKTDSNGNAVDGAVFGLFDITETVFTQDNALMQAASGKDGNFTFSDIPFGNYIIREISAAEGYLLCEEGIPVSIDQDGKEIEITVINKRAEGNVRLVKISSYDTKLHLSGAEFEIYKDVDGNGAYTEGTDTFVCNLTETDKGIYTANNLPCGKYLLYEKKAPKGYVRDLKYYPFEIKGENECVDIENVKGKGFMNVPVNPSPKTGDNSHIEFLVLIMAISALGIVVFGRKTFKKGSC